jgi:menaquinone-dependent protoporphyrinogen oxidase
VLQGIQEVDVAGSVLVAYASRYGSTREVAEAVADTIRSTGAPVDLAPLPGVHSLEGYAGVVLGAPLYMFRWHKDAKRFLSRHRTTLTSLPVAVFAMGPFNDKKEEWEGARDQLAKELAGFPWLAPAASAVFGGAFDPARLKPPYSLIPALKKLPPADIRNWDDIRAWATEITPLLTGG